MTQLVIDGATTASTPNGCADQAAAFEEMQLNAAWTFEASHDPFLPLAIAAERTNTIELGTAIAVAFARNPMTCAVTAWDLQRLSNGRFILGLGTQIRPHITKRYSETWSQPAIRMREYIAALHAIWDNFQSGEKLDFRGEFYTHTLMTPFFSPGPLEGDRPKIYVAGVGPKMVETIGHSADGFFVHPFHTPDHMEAETLPVLRAAAQLAFYGSTPAYAGVLEYHGYEHLQPELNQLSKQGAWREMAEKIDDDLVDLLCVSGTPSEVGAKLKERNQFADRSTMMFYGPPPDPDAVADTVRAARA